jgi:hypothetical protein
LGLGCVSGGRGWRRILLTLEIPLDLVGYDGRGRADVLEVLHITIYHVAVDVVDCARAFLDQDVSVDGVASDANVAGKADTDVDMPSVLFELYASVNVAAADPTGGAGASPADLNVPPDELYVEDSDIKLRIISLDVPVDSSPMLVIADRVGQDDDIAVYP